MTDTRTNYINKVHTPVSSVFVVGNSRSGTTLMARMIGRHRDVAYLPETHFFGELWEPDTENRPLSPERAIEIVSVLLSRVRHGYYSSGTLLSYRDEAIELLSGSSRSPWEIFSVFQQYVARQAGKKIACEQTPKNLYYLDRIFERYPNSRAICMIRDPRDVILSQRGRWRRRWFGSSSTPLSESFRAWANYHPVTTSKLWNSAADRIDHCRDNSRCVIVRYEDLIEDPSVAMQRIMRFLQLEFDPQQLVVQEGGSSEIPNVEGRFGIRADRAGAWKARKDARADIQICQTLCQSRMAKFGYETEPVHYSRILGAYKFMTLPFQLLLAFVLNAGRWKNLGVAIRHRFGVP